MKAKWIIPLLVVIAAGVSLTIWSPKQATSEESGEAAEAERATQVRMQKLVEDGGLVPAAENEFLALYFDNHTGGIAVEEKSTATFFYSNPQDALEDPKASDDIKQKLMSQVELVYHVKDKEGDLEMNSYKDAMLLNQISWGKLDQGLRIELVLGREEQRLLIPQQITKTSFEKSILDLIESARGKRQMQAYYILYTREDLEGANGAELLAKYPALENEDIYVLKSSINDRDKKVIEQYVKDAGYTYEMLEEEYRKIGYTGEDAAFPYFKINMDYVLQDNGVNVGLNVDDIQYDREKFDLVKLSLLNYFGAGKTGEEGYLFLPDGSGTLMNFNNDGSKTTLLTTGKLYGQDNALKFIDRGSIKQEFRAPVFGIRKKDAAFLSVVQEGDAVAEINGMLGNIIHSWNTAYATFTIRNKDSFIAENAFEQDPWIIYEKNGYKGKIAMRYVFLAGEDADYVGMAKAYREHLIAEGSIAKIEPESDIPFFLDTMGSVDLIVRKLGIPIHSQVGLTSFDQAGVMLDELSRRGVNNVKLRYLGWYNGGHYHTAPAKMKVESVLGGTTGLRKLSEKAQGMGAQVFPDVDFIYVSTNKAFFDGFSPNRDAIRTLFQKTGFSGFLEPSTLEYVKNMWTIHPKRIPAYYDAFSNSYDELGLDAISVSTMGEGLHSNFKNNDQVNRQQSKTFVTDVLKKAEEDYEQLITDYGNAYTYPYADHILNLPEEDSSFAISDRQVPFLQIALHGYIRYAGKAINLASDVRPAVLKAIEYGSGVYFKLNEGDPSILKDAQLFNDVYASRFADWQEDAPAVYDEINTALKDVQDQAIVNHEQLEDGVYKTTFENGKAIVVNYNDKEIQVGDLTIDPMDFAVIIP